MTKTFSNRSNCIRAARKALGADAQPGRDFSLLQVEGAWAWKSFCEALREADAAVEAAVYTQPAGEPIDRKVIEAEVRAAQGTALVETIRSPVVSPDGGATWRALYEGKAPKAEPVEDEEPAPVAAPAVPHRGKAGALIAAAASPAGITNAEIKALTGWTKFGGFFSAVQRAGLKLNRVREHGDTRWFAVKAEA
jgi:hypothetical protein